MDKWPNVYVVGAGKAGTTALYYYFEKHPEVFVPSVKELNFMALDGQPTFPDRGSVRVNERSIWKEEDYLSLFADWDDEKIACDCSPSYLYYPKAAEEIARRRPDAKIVILLRQPVLRAYSSYLHCKKSGSEDSESFEKALENEERYRKDGYWFHSHYLSASDYLPQLKRYFDLFPADQIHVIEYQEFDRDQSRTLNALYRFLGIAPNADEKRLEANRSGEVKSTLLANLVFRSTRLRQLLRPLVPRSYRRVIMNAFQRLTLSKQSISGSTFKRLNKQFSSDFEEISTLTGIDTSSWRAL